MKKSIFIILILLNISAAAIGQTDTTDQENATGKNKKSKSLGDFLSKQIKISQSMETAEQRDEPAQLQVTIPKNDTISYLVDIGLVCKLNRPDSKFVSKIVSEYHKKTETDAPQNNFQVGYGYTWRLVKSKQRTVYFNGDLKYVYDGVAIQHSAALDASITPYNTDTNYYINWNAPKKIGKSRFRYFISPQLGFQSQNIFKNNETSTSEGIIVRPTLDIQSSISIHKKDTSTIVVESNKVLELSAKYIGRIDAVNTTGTKENYTSLFTASLRYYIPYKSGRPKASLGISYNNGSDPLKGLAKQEYWLFSFNLSK